MSEYLEALGYEVAIYGLPEKRKKCISNLKFEIENTDAIILPLPVSKDGKYLTSVVPVKETIDDIIPMLKSSNIVFGGMINKGLEKKIEKKGCKVYDFFKREDVTVMNTVPTAQGIIKAMIDNIEYTIFQSNCAIFGYGRVAKITADILSSMGAYITVCARKYGDLALAQTKGYESCMISDFHKSAHKFNIIINTVPTLVIDKKILENLRSDCLIIDVASSPFGTDFATAYELGLNAIQCSSLPGKVAPKTAGKIIADGILNIIKEGFDE